MVAPGPLGNGGGTQPPLANEEQREKERSCGWPMKSKGRKRDRVRSLSGRDKKRTPVRREDIAEQVSIFRAKGEDDKDSFFDEAKLVVRGLLAPCPQVSRNQRLEYLGFELQYNHMGTGASTAYPGWAALLVITLLPHRAGTDTMCPEKGDGASEQLQAITSKGDSSFEKVTDAENIVFSETAKESKPARWGVVRMTNHSVEGAKSPTGAHGINAQTRMFDLPSADQRPPLASANAAGDVRPSHVSWVPKLPHIFAPSTDDGAKQFVRAESSVTRPPSLGPAAFGDSVLRTLFAKGSEDKSNEQTLPVERWSVSDNHPITVDEYRVVYGQLSRWRQQRLHILNDIHERRQRPARHVPIPSEHAFPHLIKV
ncbi:MAG: hypothetical protein Q9191_003808 [Dirinaria sp. TL-2023a]